MNAAGGGAPAMVKRGRVRDAVLRLVGVVEDGAEDGGRHAGEGHAVLLDQAEDVGRDDRAQDDVGRAHGGDRERAAPAAGVEHRQRPELDVVVADARGGR